ncbi:hypothetical protein FRC02_009541 [Tulasnella sp. 418]|nr:hypothetical protein FRC02_009541 [Tulasnella sp. 418]
MCVGFYTLAHPDYALILCTNRDEFLERPTLRAQFHTLDRRVSGTPASEERSPILSGIDAAAGGTWLGIHQSGRVAMLTNITEAFSQREHTRGELTSAFLGSDPNEPLEEYAKRLTLPENHKDYAGFNLTLFQPTPESESTGLQYDGFYVTNSGGGGNITYRTLSKVDKKMGGITNGVENVDGGMWLKLIEGKTSMEALLGTPDLTEEQLVDGLFGLLSLQNPAPPTSRYDLRKTIRVPPIKIESHNASGLGATSGPRYYGTRLSTVILITRKGEVLFVERDIWKLDVDGGQPVMGSHSDDRRFRFSLALPK